MNGPILYDAEQEYLKNELKKRKRRKFLSKFLVWSMFISLIAGIVLFGIHSARQHTITHLGQRVIHSQNEVKRVIDNCVKIVNLTKGTKKETLGSQVKDLVMLTWCKQELKEKRRVMNMWLKKYRKLKGQ